MELYEAWHEVWYEALTLTWLQTSGPDLLLSVGPVLLAVPVHPDCLEKTTNNPQYWPGGEVLFGHHTGPGDWEHHPVQQGAVRGCHQQGSLLSTRLAALLCDHHSHGEGHTPAVEENKRLQNSPPGPQRLTLELFAASKQGNSGTNV